MRKEEELAQRESTLATQYERNEQQRESREPKQNIEFSPATIDSTIAVIALTTGRQHQTLGHHLTAVYTHTHAHTEIHTHGHDANAQNNEKRVHLPPFAPYRAQHRGLTTDRRGKKFRDVHVRSQSLQNNAHVSRYKPPHTCHIRSHTRACFRFPSTDAPLLALSPPTHSMSLLALIAHGHFIETEREERETERQRERAREKDHSAAHFHIRVLR